jgi:hypothetical protein
MTDAPETSSPLAVVYRLRDAVNAHDLDALVDCFAPEFRSELPTFPDASFVGSENVRRNWGRIFSSVPDITAEIVRSTSDADMVWVEWVTGPAPAARNTTRSRRPAERVPRGAVPAPGGDHHRWPGRRPAAADPSGAP